LYGPLNAHQSDGCEHLCRNYSIADMAAYPWVVPYERERQDTSQCPFLATWFERIQTFSGDPAGLRNCQTNDTALTVDRNAKTAV
jgi:GST-like protein